MGRLLLTILIRKNRKRLINSILVLQTVLLHTGLYIRLPIKNNKRRGTDHDQVKLENELSLIHQIRILNELFHYKIPWLWTRVIKLLILKVQLMLHNSLFLQQVFSHFLRPIQSQKLGHLCDIKRVEMAIITVELL